ncbi:unnamed protein product, partial [marine sediment metagenome]
MYPGTYRYFDRLRSPLAERRSSAIPKEPFYAIYGIGPYTSSPYKVCWSEVANEINAAVIGTYKCDYIGEKVAAPDHTVVTISFDNETEAHYVCGLLNSSSVRLVIKGY